LVITTTHYHSLPIEIVASAHAKNSEYGTSVGYNKKGEGLNVMLPSSIFHMFPDAAEYYKSKIKSLIPFEVLVIIEGPNLR